MYSVISVIVDSLPANTKTRESTHSWLIRVRFLHPWAATAHSLEDEARNGERNAIEILNGGEILVNCKFKLNKNLNLNLYREIPQNSKSQFDFVP